MIYQLKDVEAGYARVVNTRGHTLGFVVKDDFKPIWRAVGAGKTEFGVRDTRKEAIALLLDRAQRRG